MDCDKNQQSTEKEDSYLNIDLSKPEDIFDFSVQPVSTSTLKSQESQLILAIKPPPKLSELQITFHVVHVIDDKDSTDKKHFQCDHCNKIFVNAAHIKRHVLTHTGERPYCCRVCNERFLRNDYLLSHIRRHKRKKLHKCCVCKKTYYKWTEFVTHCLTHDASEYENIMVQEMNTTLIMSSRKKSTDKQDKSSNGLQKKESPTFPNDKLFYQANISSPIYSSNCRPLSAAINHAQYNAIPSTYNDQCLPHRDISFSHQSTITLYYQKLQPTSQSSLQQNLSQPPELMHVPPLGPISDQHDCFLSSSANIKVSPVEHGFHEMLNPQGQQSLLQSDDDMIQPPHLIPMPPLQPIHT